MDVSIQLAKWTMRGYDARVRYKGTKRGRTHLNNDENRKSETGESSEVSQILFEYIQSSDSRFSGSIEGIGLVHFGQEGTENEVENSREESEGSCDQEEPVIFIW